MLMGPGRRRGRRRGLIVGAAVGSSMARRNAQQQADDQAAPAADDTEQQLQQLQDMHAKGLITQEEFDAKRKQILGL